MNYPREGHFQVFKPEGQEITLSDGRTAIICDICYIDGRLYASVTIENAMFSVELRGFPAGTDTDKLLQVKGQSVMIDDPADIRVSPHAQHAHTSVYAFDPQPDITVWELAKCVALIQNIGLKGDNSLDKIRAWGITRHFIRLTA